MALTPLLPGDPPALGAHRLLGRLGQGGMGTVYLGVAPDERAVAVKVLREGPSDAAGRRRFRRELQVLQRVRGPHLVEVLGGDVDAETPWIVTRFVPGRRLDEHVIEHGPLDESALRRVGVGIAEGLSALHAAGVVHRDLTPGNVLLLDGEPYVIDLGLAVVGDVTAHTGTGLVVGTAGYLAPEQVLGDGCTEAVDVHAWWATLALAGTGRPPYGTGRPEAVLYRVVHAEPDLAGLPAGIADVVAAALVKEPRERPSPAELLAALGARHLVGASSGSHAGQPGSLPPEQTTVLGARAPDTTVLAAQPADGTAVLGVRPADGTAVLPLPRTSLLATPPPRSSLLVTPPPVDGPVRPYRSHRLDPTAAREGNGRDDRADRGQPPGPEGQLERPERHPPGDLQATVLGASGLAVLGGAACLAPLIAAVVALTGLVLLHALARSADELRDRQERRGPRRRDGLVVLVVLPWRVVTAVGATLFAAPLIALAALAGGLAVRAVLAAPGDATVVAGGVVAGALAALVRPRARASRRLLRLASARVVPTPAAATAVCTVLLAGAAALLAVARSMMTSWWPLLSSPLG